MSLFNITSDYASAEQSSNCQRGDDGCDRLFAYCPVDEEAVFRGVTLQRNLPSPDPFSTFDTVKSLQSPPFVRETPQHAHEAPSELSVAHPSIDFSQYAVDGNSQPPYVPFGGVASTSFELAEQRSLDAFGALYNFLQSSGKVTKIKLPKYSITAEIFLEEAGRASWCEVKGRLFRASSQVDSPTESRQILAELTRRRGDSVAFSKVFHRAEASLGAERRRCEQTEAVAVPPELPYESDCMQPLVDTLMGAMSPEVQAEGLVALLPLMESPAALAELHTACANLESVLPQFTTSSLFHLSYPAQRLATFTSAASAVFR